MKENYIAKINSMGKIGYSVAKICQIIVTIAMVCCIVGSVLLALVPQNGVMITTSHNAAIEMDMTHSIMPNLVAIDPEADGSFELDGIKYEKFNITDTPARQTVFAQSTPYTYSLNNMMWVTLVAAGMCLLLTAVTKRIAALFMLFRNCETPFTSEIADSFRKLAISFVPVIVVGWILEAVTEWVTTGVLNITIGIDLTVVLLVVVVLMLGEIFRYGTMLQQESDETL